MKELHLQLEQVAKIPGGFISVQEFAKRVDNGERTVYYAVVRNRFPMSAMRSYQRPGKKAQILIAESQVQPYLTTGRRTKPGPPKKSHRPPKTQKLPPVTGGAAELSPGPGDNTQDRAYWVLRNEQIKAVRAGLELQKARNEVLSIQEVTDFVGGVSVSVRQGMLGVAPRLVPLLVGKTDVREMTSIIETEVRAVLNELSKLEKFTAEKRGTNGSEKPS